MKRSSTATDKRPKLIVYRSLRSLEAQVLDQSGEVLHGQKSTDSPAAFGKQFAQQLSDKQITHLVFDRRSYRYLGRISAFVAAVRAGGITI